MNRFENAQNYVCGFAFDEAVERVVLIRKLKPDWQKGLLNGVGGKVEPFETLPMTMVREFEEETGFTTHPTIWRPMLYLQDGTDKAAWIVHFFAAYGVPLDQVGTQEEEEVFPVSWKSVAFCDNPRQVYFQCVPNLRWLLPMAAQQQVRGGFLSDLTGAEG